MAIVNKGFPGTVNATYYAKSWYGGGSNACTGTGWLVSQGTGRQTSTAAGDAFAAGVVSENSAPILTSLSTPTNGQWFLIVRRIDWAGAGTVTVAAIAHTTTSTTIPTAAPSTFPTFNESPGVLYDHKLAWAWVRSTDTTMVLFDLREIPLEPRLQVNETAIATNTTSVVTLVAGPGRSSGAVYPAATPAALDALTSAVVGDVAQVTLPGTGVDPMLFTAVAGSGVTIDWRVQGRIYADTKAHLDTATSTLSGISDVIFRIGDVAYAADTTISYRWNGSAWKEWDSDYITWLTAPTNLVVGTGGSAATVQRYKWVSARLWIEIEYTLGTTGSSVGTNPTATLPFTMKLVGGIGNAIMSGDGIVYDASAVAVTNYTKAIQATATTVLIRTYAGSPAAINATTPIPWAAGDKLTIGFWADPV